MLSSIRVGCGDYADSVLVHEVPCWLGLPPEPTFSKLLSAFGRFQHYQESREKRKEVSQGISSSLLWASSLAGAVSPP